MSCTILVILFFFVRFLFFFFFKQKTAYEMRSSDWSSDVCSSDLLALQAPLRDSRSPAGGPGDDRGDHVLAGARQRRPAAAAGAGGAGSLAARARRHRAAALHRHHGLTEHSRHRGAERQRLRAGAGAAVRPDRRLLPAGGPLRRPSTEETGGGKE